MREGARGECSRGAGGAPDEHVHQAWRAYLNTPDEDSGSDSGLSREDSDSGLPGLLSPATPTLWWELPGPVIPLFPGSMAKSNNG